MGPPGHYQLEDGLYDKPKSRKKTYLYSALVLLLLIAAGVGIGVVVSRLGENDNSSASDTKDATTGGSAASGTTNSQSGETVDTTDGGTSSSSGSGSGTGTSDGSSSSSGSGAETPPGTKDFPDPPPPVDPTTPAVPVATPPAPAVSPPPSPAPILAPPPIIAPVAVPPAPVPVIAPVAVPPVAVPPAPAPVEVPTVASGGLPNTWATLPDVPLPMGEVGAGVLKLNNNPYLVIAGEHPKEETLKNGVTMILDLTGGEWTEAAKRPSIGNHHAAEVINNKLYLFGGLSGGEQDLQIGTLVPGTAGVDISWKMGAPLPFASGSASTALISGMVYYCGGINKANTKTLNTCAAYNPTTNTWSTTTAIAPMPVGRNHAATCTDGKKMYIFGGRFGKNIVGEGFDETQIYDPLTNTWAAGTPLPVARGGMGKGVYHAESGKCYVFGGEVWENEAPSLARKITAERVSVATDIYTIGSNSWSSGADMPVGLHGSFPLEYDGAVLLASGGIQAAYSQSQNALAYTL